MKLIRTFEGMSMNSLKPSINSEPESSLDSCMMKEVDDCILSKDLNSQDNEEKELCVTDFEIGSVGNTPKKMFEQVDLNSSLPNTEVTHKKDSWNPGPLFDKTSEKENMVEPSEATYDVLSDDDDDDDNDSIHLKISDDEENSNPDSEINDLSSFSVKPLLNCEDKISENAKGNVENENASCAKEDLAPSANIASELSEGIAIDNIISDKETESSAQCDGETEGENTIGTETKHEDIPEEPEPTCSDSPELSVNGNSCNTLETMVNEVKSVPTSHESFNSKENLETPDSNLEISNEGSLTNSDKSGFKNCVQEASQCDDNPQTSLDDVEPEVTEKCDSSSDEVIPQGQTTDIQVSDYNSNSEDAVHSSSEKEVILLSDDAADLDNKEMDEAVINDNIEKETVGSEEAEEIDCESTEDIQSPNSAEMNDSVKEAKLVTEDSTNDSLDSVSTVKNSSTEERFLEILEYQPNNEEMEELKEIQSDKEMSCSEIDHNSSLEEENASELSVPAELCSDKEIKKSSNLPSQEINNPEKVDDSPVKIDTVSVTSVKSVSKENSECEGSVNIVSETGPSVTEDLQRLDSSENEGVSEENNSMDEAEKDEDVNFPSKNINSMKTELPPKNCEANSTRKRTSNCEENLVNSKRMKVAISESEVNDECDVLVCEQTTESEQERIAEVGTKEKCDSRAKRLSSSSDVNDVKKVRVMSDPFQVEKDEEIRGEEITVRNVELVKDDERNVNSKREPGKTEEVKLNALPFLRSFSRSRLKNLSRNDLEELVLQKICEAITERSHCGELRELAQSLEQKIKAWQKKSLQLTKQVKDLNLVLKRYSTDLQSKGPNAVPVKITRSVGLQVQMPGASNLNWLHEETTRRKTDKSSPSAPMLSTPSSGPTSVKTCTPSPAKVVPANAPKVSEASDSQGASCPSRQNPPSNPPTVGGTKILPSKPPTSLNSVSSNASKSNNKQQSSPANNKSKSSPDLQIIDLTDPEEKTKNSASRLPTVSSALTATSVPVPISSAVISSGTNSNSVANVSAGCRSIRVVQHLGGSTPILTQTGTNAVAGQRVTYFVPTTSVPVQQRQLIISSASQIRPSGVMSMSQRQNPLPTILLKPGQVVPVSPTGASGANIIRTTISNPLQLASRAQPRTGQIFQRVPTSPVQSSALSVVQSSGLSVSSVSHPAPLPPIPPTMTNNANMKLPPPKPDLKISKVPNNRNQQGIVLSWNMTVTSEYEEIASYQLFAYQEGSAPPSTQLWKKVGDVKALPLPMACTLTQFMEGHKYHFAVRAVDVYARYGPFSAPGNIVLTRN